MILVISVKDKKSVVLDSAKKKKKKRHIHSLPHRFTDMCHGYYTYINSTKKREKSRYMLIHWYRN